eukprot:NODE_3351_length_1236_cov_43.675651_g3180_i0.p1 GENE.NODE_3351_length_1236_cov_43.675651_g3180_i0~~NODE_3351_length_1236_cov_43.675651_g3180_i0.p1  ORF type:complete len:370 (+),score=65.94 NODE_3351_length_1236_cov_43.675651_g3180_i0:62-1171(+)
MSDDDSSSDAGAGDHRLTEAEFAEWDDEDPQETQDLLSDKTFPSAEKCLQFMIDTYQFDLKAVCSSRRMDFYTSMRYVNYIRTLVSQGEKLTAERLSTLEVPEEERFLIPVVESDPLLQVFDMDEDDEGESFPHCPPLIELLREEVANMKEADKTSSSTNSVPFALDEFVMRQFDDPNFAGTRITTDKDTMLRRITDFHQKLDMTMPNTGERWPALVPGYAPFCKHLFMPVDVAEGYEVPVVDITSENEHLLRTGYAARTDKELPVLTRWFPRGTVPAKPAAFLDIILYSREQCDKERQATGEPPLPAEDAAPWRVISIKAQEEGKETPMQPITAMRNALVEEGGSGVKLDREAYMQSVAYWSTRAVIG